MKCKKCKNEMLPTGQEYTVEIWECQECGHEEFINEDGVPEVDYREAWVELGEWIDSQTKEYSHCGCYDTADTYRIIRNKMEVLINE